ncbi:hypothetical protein ACTFIU_010352 [Dictyostelium citrinum]
MSKPDLNSLSIKMKQINLLKERFSHTIEVVKDSTFKIPFLNVHLIISLPVNFPNSPPAYFLEILQTHQPVSLPPNYQWTQISNLASVTVHIMEPFIKDSRILESLIEQVKRSQAIQQQQQQQQQQRNQQQVQQAQQPQYSPPPPYKDQPINKQPAQQQQSQPVQQKPQQQSQPPQQQPQQQNGTPNKIPMIPTEFPELKSKSLEELEELLKNEDSLNAFIYSYDEVSELSDRKSKLLSENERLTKITDPLPNDINDLSANIMTSRQKLEELKRKQEQLQQKKNSITDKYSQQNLLEILNDSISDLESESDNIVSSFLDGNLELKEFKKQFKEKRSSYHSKCANKDLFFK